MFSLIVILFIYWWLYLIVALAIKMTSKGPVLFKQPRSGRANETFLCYKFRTMTVNNDSDLKQATKGDIRITKIGQFLRSSSLDEMPQFLNVLKGDMSVVGPRPHMLKHTEDYRKIIDKFMVRHLIKPGITGLAQVRGYRGETKDAKEMELRVKSDVWYIENWSFLLDVKLILLTLVNAVKGQDKAF
jgi:lipopolysaccharide/colanic/teichoic acid biosynthesis glycosyltransferase